MKVKFAYLLLLFSSFTCEQISAQITIDLRTGAYDGGGLLPVNSLDDSWSVMLPGTNYYQSIRCGIGQKDDASWYPGFPAPAGVSSRVLSPYLNGSAQCLPNGLAGTTYYYKMTFNLSSCPVTGATITVRKYISDDNLDEMTLNTSHTVLGGPNSSLGPYWPSNYVYSYLGIQSFLHQGQNEIVFKVTKTQNGWVGFEFDGTLYVETCASVDLNLKDKDGNIKTGFCIDEDVFLTAVGTTPASYVMNLLQDNGNGVFSQVASTQPSSGPLNGVNIKDIFELQSSFVFQTGQNYRLEIPVSNYCGPFVISKDFTFNCCDNSPDASFSLFTNSGTPIYGNSTTSGNHLWTVYSAPTGNTGPYTRIGLFTYNKTFSLNDVSPCYYVEHKVTNACGTACSAESICNYACTDVECIISAPKSVLYNASAGVLTWTSVNNAASYIIEIIMNDSHCPNCPPAQVSTPNDKIIIPFQNSQNANTCTLALAQYLAQQGTELANPCFSWKVYAVCADGTKSSPSATGCSN